MTKIDATNVSTTDLAAILGMTRDGVTRLCRAGVISQNGIARGKYDLREAISSYAKHTRETHGESADTRLAIQRERKIRLQNDKTEDGLIDIGDAAEVFKIFYTEFRTQVNGCIKGMADSISKTDSPHKVAKIMQSEFNVIGQAAYDGLQEVNENERKN